MAPGLPPRAPDPDPRSGRPNEPGRQSDPGRQSEPGQTTEPDRASRFDERGRGGPSDAGRELRRYDDIREGRRERRDGDRTIIQEPGGRTIIREDGRTIIRRDEADRFRRSNDIFTTERRGQETVTILDRPDGTRIVTYTDPDGRLIRRSRRERDGREDVLIDNRARAGGRGGVFVDLPPPVIGIPRNRYILEAEGTPYGRLYDTLIAPPVARLDRRYTLDEIRYSPEVRARMPRIDIDTVIFASGAWDLSSDQVARLAEIARALNEAIGRNPREVFLIEGHTDAVGPADENLSLSDRRAEAVAVALQDTFRVPPENLTTQGYGEQQLKIPTREAEPRNRRVTVRRITPLLTGDAAPPRR